MVRKSAAKPPTPVGEVVIANKADVIPPPPPPPTEISATKYEKEVRPKRPLSEKQQQNLAKLIERNKARAVERREVVKEVIPESIPEDKILVRIKPKRAYNRKPKEETSKNVVVVPVPEPTPEPTPAPSETEYSESEPEVKPRKPRKPRERKQVPKKALPRYTYDTETTTADDDSSSDEDDYKARKYQMKAEKRIKALEKIDKRLNQLQSNPYQSREMSVF